MRVFFRVKHVVLTRRRCALPPCAYARIRMITRTLKILYVVHVRVLWITETRKEKTQNALVVLGSAALAAAVVLPR